VLAERANMAACIRHGTLRYIALGDDERDARAVQKAQLADIIRMESRLEVVRGILGLGGYPEEISPHYLER
jgi:N-acyl-D-aspartate/D-glutamate deacylase